FHPAQPIDSTMLSTVLAMPALSESAHGDRLKEASDTLHRKYCTNGSRPPIWDAACVATAFGFSTQAEQPRPVVHDDASFSFPNNRTQAPFRWVTDLNREQVFSNLAENLKRNLRPIGRH